MLALGLNLVKTAISRVTSLISKNLQGNGQSSTDYLAGNDQTGSDHLLVNQEV
jgi:hypothetical protein